LAAIPNKWRIADDVGSFATRHQVIPIHPQRVPFHDSWVGSQRQRLCSPWNGKLCFLDHLLLGNPQCSPCYRYGKIVDFDTVKLPDGDLYRAVAFETEWWLAFLFYL
jgi:hypothetical protein